MAISKAKPIILTSFIIGASLLAVKFATKYQSAANDERTMMAMTQSLLRVNRDEASRDSLVRAKVDELKEQRELVASSRQERADGLSRPCSTGGLFAIKVERLLMDYDNYLNSKNGIYTFSSQKTGRDLRPDEMFDIFKETESSSREWLLESARRCAWGYGEGGVDSLKRQLRFFFG